MAEIFKNEDDLRIILEVTASEVSFSDSSETYLIHDFKVHDLDNGDLMMWGSVKWDGCCDFFFKDGAHHTCDSLETYAKRLQWISDSLNEYID